MNFATLQTALNRVLDPSMWILKGARIILIAIAFEIALWALNRFLERQTAPMLNADANREVAWKSRRRQALRQVPKNFGRAIIYTVGFLLVLNEFGAPILPLSLGIGAVVAFFAAGLVPILRDITQGYTLLAEDTVAIGDQIQIGNYSGTVERFSMRATTLRDRDGHLHVLSNRDVCNVTVLSRREEKGKAK